jgi:TonB family protein
MKLFLACFFSLFLFSAFAKKDTVVTYHDHKLNEISKKDYYTYYRKTFRTSESTYGVLQFYRSGVLQMSGTLEIPSMTLTGLLVQYNPQGILISEDYYENGLKEGLSKTWYSNGSSESEGTYLKNKKSGFWTTWHIDGSIQSQGNYVDGDEEGEWNVWYKGDKIASTGNYKFGKRDGPWKNWFKNGSIEQEGTYKEDKREGAWTFYFQSGPVSAKEIYQNGEAVKVEFWDEQGNPVEPTDVLEKDPEFPGGEKAMLQFIQQHIIYPELSREMGEQGTIYVNFTVGGDGKIYDVNVLMGVSYLLDNEAIRVVKKMPDWVPGFSHNRVMDVLYLIPIKFTIA